MLQALDASGGWATTLRAKKRYRHIVTNIFITDSGNKAILVPQNLQATKFKASTFY
ncbi:hypothetical protein [Marinobacterium lutimaris]|uniref:hypothetical protein n=1 Tax=Marinobacterium lutimaris TaxID=568106 RepID=UPI00135C1501|nr:hypothetical protein [Marinobacterium lutimaris]